jgi:hypothetical protein
LTNSFRLAFCGIATALCTLLMFLTGIISIGTYAFPALAGVLLIAVVIEFGKTWAWLVYAAGSMLSLFLAGDKEAVVLFIFFLGYYPILKSQIEKIHNRVAAYILKFSVFNVSMVACFFLSIKLLSVPEDSFTVAGIYLPWVFLLIGNIIFAVYDYALSLLVVSYFQRFHPYFRKWSK